MIYQWVCTECAKRVEVERKMDDSSFGPTTEEVRELLTVHADDSSQPHMCNAVGGHQWRRAYSAPLTAMWPNSTGPVKGRA